MDENWKTSGPDFNAWNEEKTMTDAPKVEPYGYAFQHEETGLQQVVDVQQVEWGFEKNNPRWQKLGPVYLHLPHEQVAVIVDDKPIDQASSHPEWIWYCESTSGVPVISLGRWPKHPQQRRYKYAEIQETEHDHPAQCRSE